VIVVAIGVTILGADLCSRRCAESRNGSSSCKRDDERAADEYEQFESAVAATEEIDEDVWR
jgi:hypothetical protein